MERYGQKGDRVGRIGEEVLTIEMPRTLDATEGPDDQMDEEPWSSDLSRADGPAELRSYSQSVSSVRSDNMSEYRIRTNSSIDYSVPSVSSCTESYSYHMSVEQSEPDSFEYLSSDCEEPMSHGTFDRAESDGTKAQKFETPQSSFDTSVKEHDLIGSSTSGSWAIEEDSFCGADENISCWAVPSQPRRHGTFKQYEEDERECQENDKQKCEHVSREQERKADVSSTLLPPHNQFVNGISEIDQPQESSHRGRPRRRHQSLPDSLPSRLLSHRTNQTTSKEPNLLCGPAPNAQELESPDLQNVLNEAQPVHALCDQENDRGLDFNTGRLNDRDADLLVQVLQNTLENGTSAGQLYDALPTELRAAVCELESSLNVQLKSGAAFVTTNDLMHALTNIPNSTPATMFFDYQQTNAVLTSGAYRPASTELVIPSGRTMSSTRLEANRNMDFPFELSPPEVNPWHTDFFDQQQHSRPGTGAVSPSYTFQNESRGRETSQQMMALNATPLSVEEPVFFIGHFSGNLNNDNIIVHSAAIDVPQNPAFIEQSVLTDRENFGQTPSVVASSNPPRPIGRNCSRPGTSCNALMGNGPHSSSEEHALIRPFSGNVSHEFDQLAAIDEFQNQESIKQSTHTAGENLGQTWSEVARCSPQQPVGSSVTSNYSRPGTSGNNAPMVDEPLEKKAKLSSQMQSPVAGTSRSCEGPAKRETLTRLKNKTMARCQQAGRSVEIEETTTRSPPPKVRALGCCS